MGCKKQKGNVDKNSKLDKGTKKYDRFCFRIDFDNYTSLSVEVICFGLLSNCKDF